MVDVFDIVNGVRLYGVRVEGAVLVLCWMRVMPVTVNRCYLQTQRKEVLPWTRLHDVRVLRG